MRLTFNFHRQYIYSVCAFWYNFFCAVSWHYVYLLENTSRSSLFVCVCVYGEGKHTATTTPNNTTHEQQMNNNVEIDPNTNKKNNNGQAKWDNGQYNAPLSVYNDNNNNNNEKSKKKLNINV